MFKKRHGHWGNKCAGFHSARQTRKKNENLPNSQEKILAAYEVKEFDPKKIKQAIWKLFRSQHQI